MDPRPTFAELLPGLLSRRRLLASLGQGLASAALWPGLASARNNAAWTLNDGALQAGEPASTQPSPSLSSLRFEEVQRGRRSDHAVSAGHSSQVLLRWGDPLFQGAPAFDPLAQSPAAQARQFGTGNDFLAFAPLPYGSSNSQRGLLTVNHEHASPKLMFPRGTPADVRARIMLESHGLSVVELVLEGGLWRLQADSPYNRRITGSTPIVISGPAAGSPRLATSADPSGRLCLGTLGNCGGGVTPWGTVLSGEENVQEYFAGTLEDLPERERAAARAMGLGPDVYGFSKGDGRFDVRLEPNEPNRFGWVVEIDPYAPQSPAKKRTALGRFRHEGATTVINPDGRLVVYMGDDAKGECLYRFVSARPVDPQNRQANQDLLDNGELSVARFDQDGRVEWLPLVHGQGPLVAANGFGDQSDVVIETRRAARLLGGTPLDRPEDVEAHPHTGLVYAVLTKNDSRGAETRAGSGESVERRAYPATDRANPRANNIHGHILELTPPGRPGQRDHAARWFEFDVFLLCGDPQSGATFHASTSADGWFSCPDNLTFDNRGNLWVATDGNGDPREDVDGLWALEVLADAPGRGLSKRFFAAPRGAELCGPCFTPDGTTLFVAVQHPASEGGSSFQEPSTRWPDFRPDLPPRPSILALRRQDGAPIG
jgi:hypothetical protein